MIDDLQTIRVDEFLPYPPGKVWQTLVDPDLLGQWLMPNDFKPVVGHRFTFKANPIPGVGFSGTISCEVLDVQPEEKLSISWRDEQGTATLDSTVTWNLRREGRGTRLFLEHSGFDPDDALQQVSRSVMNGGWRKLTLTRLMGVLSDLA